MRSPDRRSHRRAFSIVWELGFGDVRRRLGGMCVWGGMSIVGREVGMGG